MTNNFAVFSSLNGIKPLWDWCKICQYNNHFNFKLRVANEINYNKATGNPGH